jgi:hypothetical protein
MSTVWLIPAGTDSAEGAAAGDYLVRPSGSDLFEVGAVDSSVQSCTWLGELSASLLPSLPQVDAPQEAPDQTALLAAVQGVEDAQAKRGG